ncbi:MAG: 16S rRNA processing protein RimM [Acidobacteria bacterium]|nr:MAG: 16S rRNA processing protein RimM [Acidobacteriota bacterium]
MTSESDSSDSLIIIARAVRTRGLKGELLADLLTDFPERFEAIEQLVAVSPEGKRAIVELEDYWFQNDRVVFKLSGYDGVDAAKEFVGYEFCVPETERVELPEDEYYDFELEGCSVTELSGNSIGRVQSVLKTGGVAILTVVDDNDKEVLIPLAESIVVSVDIPSKTIVVDPPEGLFEL